MKNGENFNSAPDTSKSFEDAYGSWDTLRDELNQKQEAKAEANAEKKREEELKKGAKKFDKSVRDAIHKGDKVAFDEMMERDEHYRQMETGENQIEEEPYEAATLSKEELAQAINSSDEIRKMDLLARQMQNAGSEEAKAKYQQQLIELSNEFSKGEGAVAVKDWHDQAQWDFRKASEAEGFRQKVLDTIWENAMAEPAKENGDLNEEVRKMQGAEQAPDELIGLNGEKLVKENGEVKVEPIELTDAEKKFDEMFLNGADAGELTRYRREIRSELIQKGELTPENQEMLERMQKVGLEVGSQERELKNLESSADKDVDIEAKAGRFQKIKKFIGSRIMKWGALGMLGMTIFGVGKQASENFKGNDNNTPQTEQTFAGSAQAETLKDGANFNNDGSLIEGEKNFNNGKYDSENNDYNKVNEKENQYSIGTSVAELSNEDFQKKMINSHSEDDIEYMGQFFVNDTESAQNLLGVSNNEVDALVDAARNGDQTAFQKLNNAYSKYMEGAKVVGNQALNGDYYSIFVNADKDYAHSEGAFGGTARVVELKNGQQILIRDQCKQLVMKKIAEVPNTWTTPTIPFEQTYTPPTPNNDKPPVPTPENPTPDTPKTPENPEPKTPENPEPKTPETPTPDTPPTPDAPPAPDIPPKPETPPEEHKDTKFLGDQTIYNVGGWVDRADKGELTEGITEEQNNRNIDPTVTPGTPTSEVKANNIDETIDVSKIGEQPDEFGGEYTEQARQRDQEQAQQKQVEEEATKREAEQAQNRTVKIGNETVSYDDIWSAQQNYNQTYGASAAENPNSQQ